MLEQLTKNEQQMLELACSSAGLGSWTLACDTNTMTLSASFCRLLRISDNVSDENELIMPYDAFNSKYIHEEDSWFVRDYQHSPPGHKYSFRVRCSDGAERWLEAFPVVDDNPKSLIVSGVVQDVTERIASEDDLRNARKMESIRSIAGGIAHEFNNILYSMSGYIGLMKDMLKDGDALDVAELNEYVDEMAYSNKRAVRLIKKIQTFSHSGKQGIAQVNLKAAADKVLHDTPFPNGVQPQLVMSSETPVVVYVNETILRESLSNVIANGIAAMNSEKGALLIEIDEVFAAENRPVACGAIRTGYYGRVSITDKGCGMDKNTLSRIFEPFFTTRQAGEGTGLGLAIVYGMVNAAGGAVEVESGPGKGTLFRIYLPSCNAMAGEKMT